MSFPGVELVVYFTDQFMQEVERKRILLGGVEKGVGSLKSNLDIINSYLQNSKWEHYERHMPTKVKVIDQMREIAFKAEHVIDKYNYHEEMQKRNFIQKPIRCPELVRIAETIADIKTDMEKAAAAAEAEDNHHAQAQQQQAADDHHAQESLTVQINDAVGLDGHTVERVQDLINRQYSERDVLIMGMGGLGKSKLARKVYGRINVAPGERFECKAWVYGSPEFKSQDWLVKILESIPATNNSSGDPTTDTLEKRLRGKRYLVVLDGIWNNSSDEWETIKSAFPNDQNGSRILITSRGGVLNLTTCSPSQSWFLPLLNSADSWTLLCNKVFAGGRRDEIRRLEVVGKALAADCKGLPLSIIELGQLLLQNVLAGSTHSVNTWEGYKNHVNSELIRKSKRCLLVLAESYQLLPDAQSQSCFLYLSLFPKDFVYSARHLKQLWSAERLIQDGKFSRDVLDVAKDYLTNLFNQSLIQVESKDIIGDDIKTWGVHSVLRELSKFMGEREKFIELRLDNETASTNSRGRRLSVQGDILELIGLSVYNSSSARSLLLFNDTSTTYSFDETKFWKRVSQSFIYVRVLYLWKVPIKSIPKEIKNLIFLTNITILGDKKLKIDKISDSICNLEHLETIYIDGKVENCLPAAIWKMKELRNLRVSNGLRLPDPPEGFKKPPNLRMLSGVVVEKNLAHSIFTGVKKLHLVYVANKQNQQVIDAAKQKVDQARKKFEDAQKRAESLKIAKKAQKKITKAEKEVKKAQDKVKEAEGKTVKAQEFKLRTDALKSVENNKPCVVCLEQSLTKQINHKQKNPIHKQYSKTNNLRI